MLERKMVDVIVERLSGLHDRRHERRIVAREVTFAVDPSLPQRSVGYPCSKNAMADLVIIRAGRITAIECKLTNYVEALRQAQQYQAAVHEALVVMPADVMLPRLHGKNGNAIKQNFKDSGVGLAVFRSDGYRPYTVVVKPAVEEVTYRESRMSEAMWAWVDQGEHELRRRINALHQASEAMHGH